MNILAALRSALRIMTSSVPVLEEDFVLRAIVASAMLVQPLPVNPDPVAAVSRAKQAGFRDEAERLSRF